MDEEIIIRLGVTSDVETIVGFNIAMAKETEEKTLDYQMALSGAKSLFNNPENGFYLVAEKQGKVIGSLMITKEWSDWRNGDFWWIQSVYINAENRRKGIYSLLYSYVKKMAKIRSDVCGIRLYVEKENRVAQNTYSSLGMQEAHYKVFEEEF